jgi:eukaryotic-like serine/threonine-protein kinase
MSLLKIGQYRLLENLGSGGSGDVYIAEDTRLHRKVALKLFRRDDRAGPEQLVEEARIASLVNHPNVLTIYDIGHHDNHSYIVTEYVVGETLRQRMNRGAIPLLEVLDIAIGVAGALSAAHEVWLVHRDIKPENVMLRQDGAVKVLDFGIAKLLPPITERGPGQGGAAIVGTLQYLSPEQVRGDVVDSRSDLFSLGVVLYEMVAGFPPFGGAEVLQLLAEIVEADPPPLSPHLPASLRTIIHHALGKSIWERYQTASELLEALREIRDFVAFSARMEERRGTVGAADELPPSD